MVTMKCECCGNPFSVKPYRIKTARFCSKQCRSDFERGTIVKSTVSGNNGYRKTKTNGNEELSHRYIMKRFLGRPLLRGEYVHHINGDKSDNRLENLMLMSPKEHSYHHNQKHPTTKPCLVCGKEFMPHPTKRSRAKTCSKECLRKYQSITQRNPEAPNSMYRPNAYPSQVKNRIPAVAYQIFMAIKEVDAGQS